MHRVSRCLQLGSVPIVYSLAELAQRKLQSFAEQGGQEIPSGELAHGFMQRLRAPGTQGFVTTSADAIGWTMLEATLRNAMRAGMSPAELALKIEMKVLG